MDKELVLKNFEKFLGEFDDFNNLAEVVDKNQEFMSTICNVILTRVLQVNDDNKGKIVKEIVDDLTRLVQMSHDDGIVKLIYSLTKDGDTNE